MEFNEFEKGIGDKFNDFKPGVDHEKIWKGVEESFPVAKPNYPIYLTWFVISVCLIFGSIAWLKMSEHNANSVQPTDYQTELSETEEQKIDGRDFSSKKYFDETKHAKDVVHNTTAKPDDKDEPVIHNASTSSQTDRKPSVLNLTKLAMNTPSAESPINEENANEGKEVKSELSSSTEANNQLLKWDIDYLDRTEIFPFEVKHRLLNPMDLLIDSNKDKTALADVKSHHLTLKTGIYANNIQSFSNTPQGTDLLAKRSQVEQFDNAYSFGLEYAFTFSKHWSLTAGIRYVRHQTEFIYSSSFAETLFFEDYLIATETQQDGTITVIKGPAFVTRNTHRVDHYFNTHEQWSLPIGLRYQFNLSQRIKCSSGLSAAIPIYFAIEGYELDPDNKRYNLATDAEDRYKNTGAFSVNFNGDIHYLFNHSWALQAGFYAQYGFNSFNTEQAIITKKQYLLGTSLGLTYSF